MTITGTPGPPPPDPGTAAPAPVTKEDVKKLAKSALSNPTGPDSARVKSDVTEKNGFYTFKVGDNLRTYTVSVKKAYIDGLSKEEQQAWGKGLSLQLASMYETGSTNASFNIKDRSITLNNKTFHFSTQAQVMEHKADYAKQLESLTTAQSDLMASDKEIDEIQKKINLGGHSKADLQTLKDELKEKKGERFEMRLKYREAEAQVKEIEQVHKISGQLFVEGGIKPEAPPATEDHTTITQENQTRPVPELPEMGPIAGTSGIVARARASGAAPPPPSTFNAFEHLGTESLALRHHTEGEKELNDGWTPRVKAFVDGIKEDHNLPNATTLKELRPPLTRAEQWALLSGVRRELKALDQQLKLMKEARVPSSDPDRQEVSKQIEDFKTYIKELHDVYRFSTPQFGRETQIKETISKERMKVIRQLVAVTKIEIAKLDAAGTDIDKIYAVVWQLKVAYEALTPAEQKQFFDGMRKATPDERHNFKMGYVKIEGRTDTDTDIPDHPINALMDPEKPFGKVMERLNEIY